MGDTEEKEMPISSFQKEQRRSPVADVLKWPREGRPMEKSGVKAIPTKPEAPPSKITGLEKIVPSQHPSKTR